MTDEQRQMPVPNEDRGPLCLLIAAVAVSGLIVGVALFLLFRLLVAYFP